VAVLARAVGGAGAEPLLEVLGDRRVRHRAVSALVPDDRQRLERRLRPPPGVGDHRDGTVADLDDLAYARPAGDLALVVALHLAAEYRALLDRGAQHAGQPHVDGVDFAAVELGSGVEPLQRLARDLPVLRVLERDALGIRRGELGGRGRDLAVARRA